MFLKTDRYNLRDWLRKSYFLTLYKRLLINYFIFNKSLNIIALNSKWWQITSVYFLGIDVLNIKS